MNSNISLLQKALLNHPLTLPKVLQNLSCISLEKQTTNVSISPQIKDMFPHLVNHGVVRGASRQNCLTYDKMKIGVVLSGGQASGGHNVIAGIFDAVKSLNSDSEVIGFLSGPAGVIEARYLYLDKIIIDRFRNQGGFDMLGSGRTKIESKEQLASSLQTVQKLALDGLVVIGGDDSNTNAAVLAEYFQQNGCQTTVVGVPKTIDGDLQNDHVPISFGFDSACKVYSEMIGNIATDALSAKKYY
ncbi:MAG: diphosphate--fructose-6-phosphate 1-phosphotransferase, partial [Chlamydiae bacterium]|nr:diphosphate--fructose-6-phosphate 1-phosphotransferase [Chlamydiota bacterium]